MATHKGIEWDEQPLGLFSDALLGKNLGVTPEAVFSARKIRKIPAARFARVPLCSERIDWSTWPLGLVSDGVIAFNLGCDHSSVALARRRRGIKPFKPVRPSCNPESFLPLLGTCKDREVAARFGITESQVSAARRRRGIPSSRIDWKAAPLGTAPDAHIAALYGVTHGVVACARWRQGVPRWSERRRCPCGSPFVAVRLDQRFCSHDCGRYWWMCKQRRNVSAPVADLLTALWKFRRAIFRKG